VSGVKAWTRRWGWTVRLSRVPTSDRGSAIVEFVVLAVVLMVPVAYAVVVVSHLHAATFGAITAAREAARAYVTADTTAQGSARARAAAALAMADQGMPPPVVTIECLNGSCLSPGSRVRVQVESRVVVPFMPVGVHSVRGTIPVIAVQEDTVDSYRSSP